MKERLWLVKREVLATTICEAMKKPGKIYAIEEALYKPDESKAIGFNKKSKKERK